MANLDTARNCLLKAGFLLEGVSVSDGDTAEFHSVLASDTGQIRIAETMSDDGTGGAQGVHFTLLYDLADKKAVPGLYRWELLLRHADGTAECLSPADANTLTVHGTIAEEAQT